MIRRSDIRVFYCPRATAETEEGFASVALLHWLLPPLLPSVLFVLLWRCEGCLCWTSYLLRTAAFGRSRIRLGGIVFACLI